MTTYHNRQSSIFHLVSPILSNSAGYFRRNKSMIPISTHMFMDAIFNGDIS